jgi:peptide/nickel transport system substrate-binding protein
MTGEYFNGAVWDEMTDGAKMAYAMRMWGFGGLSCTTEVAEGADPIAVADCTDPVVFKTAVSETVFDLIETFPTIEDYYNETVAAYEGDVQAAFPYESAAGTDVFASVKTAFIGYWGPLDESMGEGGVPNVSGIVKVDDYTVEITTNGYEAPAIYSILGVTITPLHYYGDVAKYDYANNKFGFDYGDLSKQQSLIPTPMGAGPYTFVRFENKVVYFEANPFYYKGEPKIKEIQFKETVSAEVPSSLATGAADAGEMSYNKTRFEEVLAYNGNGEMTGPVITSSLVDNAGYGYIGANADLVNVGGEPASDASKNLRRAIMTVLAVYRDVAIDSYYGEAAAVINYPISNTSWAAPQPTDEGYQVAYSVDVEGNPIYTAEMSYEERYAAAEQAALGFLEAAGFTVADGKITAAPDGARMSYEIIVTADGTGDHPAFAIMTGAQASLANIGMELKIRDVSDFTILTEGNTAGTNDFFALAWGSGIDPDMYQVYHSSSTPENGGNSNHYRITDPELDQLMLDARKSDDQAYRKAIYKDCLDIIIDWAVELPTYQRKNVIIFSTERLNIESLTPDITTFWGWLNDIELVEMVQP